MAPSGGFEPPTTRLTAEGSTTELTRLVFFFFFFHQISKKHHNPIPTITSAIAKP